MCNFSALLEDDVHVTLTFDSIFFFPFSKDFGFEWKLLDGILIGPEGPSFLWFWLGDMVTYQG